MANSSFSVPALTLALAALGFSQTHTDNISIDQFGYRPAAKKFAVISAAPGGEFKVVNEATSAEVFSGTPTAFDGGATDAASGNKVWHFDFSTVTDEGRYYILDNGNNTKSYSFSIKNDVYNEALKHAIRMFYYQRAGTDKPAAYAGAEWADGFAFAQDAQSRLFSDKNNAAAERDLSGGWFDAGDYNKYTKWTSDYVENMFLAFEENPEAFTDDYGIPESGNGAPDIIDEAKWGLKWLERMQNEDGSMLSVQGLASGSPPSSVTGKSYYGPANATATYGGARAFAVASRILALRGESAYSDELKERALKAFTWAEANPDSIYHNNDEEKTPGSKDLAAGDQEQTDAWDRVENRISAALYLYEITNNADYLSIFENNLSQLPLYAWNAMQQWRYSQHLLYMHYLKMSAGTASVKNDMRTRLETQFAKAGDFLGAVGTDGYRSFIMQYQWGSNKIKADYGNTFYLWKNVNSSTDYSDVAEDYLHYIHGVNPLNMVYLTGAARFGASKSVTSIYHTWFTDKSEKWDIQTSTEPGPAPGYMPGGPNFSYGKDACCDNDCGGAANNAVCTSEILPDKNTTPPAKMYKDFNTSWPLNSWEISEPSNGYQISYIRLLSKFVVKKGGGVPIAKRGNAAEFGISISNNYISVMGNGTGNQELVKVSIYNSNGKLLQSESGKNSFNVNTANLPSGLYIVKITNGARSNALFYPKGN